MANGYRIEILRRAQRVKGWTDQKLSDESGVSVATVWRIMNGRTKGHPDNIRKLAFALGVPMNEVAA